MIDRITSGKILKALAARHTKDFFMTEVKDGPTQFGSHYRMDAVAIKKSWANPCITAYEVKVDRQDFLRDEKWPVYLGLCNRLAFACPEGLIQKDELPREVGLYWYKGEGKPFRIIRHPMFRTVEIPESFYQYIIMCKIQSDRWPFFDCKEEYYKEWLDGKRRGYETGINLSLKIIEKIREANEQVERANERSEMADEAVKLQTKAMKLLQDNGITWSPWNDETWVDALEKYLRTGQKGNDFQLVKAIDRARDVLNYLETMKGGEGECRQNMNT